MTLKTNSSTSGKLFGRSVIYDPETQTPYMTRMWFGPFRYHLMHRGDLQREPHDHPWWFITFPFNSYIEEVLRVDDEGLTYLDLNFVKAYRFHFRKAGYSHRILGPDVRGVPPWKVYPQDPETGERASTIHDGQLHKRYTKIRTLVLRGRFRQKWGFWLRSLSLENDRLFDEEWDWQPADEYFANKGVPYTGNSSKGMAENPNRRPQ